MAKRFPPQKKKIYDQKLKQSRQEANAAHIYPAHNKSKAIWKIIYSERRRKTEPEANNTEICHDMELCCHVIGIAGSDEKLAWLKEELKFDGVINYKTQNVAAELKKLAPKGVDCYFDNVGGEISSHVLYQMKTYGRISVCGSISSYNNDINSIPKAPVIQMALVMNQLRMEGFHVWRWMDRWMEGIKQNLQWIQEGKLVYKETVTEGFSKMPEAFIGMLKGDNTGKAVVKA
ncbi:Prostaglandin reductase 1 [Homalodisca vitripennis]|nr:Prostaglandin reductase 1 [Homalodisca vitripennis]